MIDFSQFPNQMISGLSLSQINDVVNNCTATSGSGHNTDTYPNQNADRHAMITKEELLDLNKSMKCKATIDKMKWGIKTFKEWYERRCIRMNMSEDQKDIESMSASEINDLLEFFVHEVRKVNQENYSSESLRGLYMAIQYYFRSELERTWNFLMDKEFKTSREALNAAMKKINTDNDHTCNSSKPIPEETEELLWARGYLGDDTPKKLLRTICYLLGIHLGLRGGNEHRSLEFGKQIKLTKCGEDDVLIFNESSSKSNNGGLYHRRRNKRENVIIFPNKQSNERCPVRLYKKYVSLRPSFCTTNAFYLKALDNFENDKWYQNMPMGRNTLYSTIKNLMEAANVEGRFTNHSCRKTTGTRMHNAGFSEADIQSVTGHSSESVREYIAIGEKRKIDISNCLSNQKMEKPSNHSVVQVSDIFLEEKSDQSTEIHQRTEINQRTTKMVEIKRIEGDRSEQNDQTDKPTIRLSKCDIVVELFLN